MAPDRDVLEPKRIPPKIKHRLIQMKDSFPGDIGGSKRELAQAIVDEASLIFVDVDTGQQMP